MKVPEQENELELQSFLQLVEKKGRAARLRTVLATLIPIFAGAIVLVVIGFMIARTTNELEALTKQRDDYAGEVSDLTEQVRALTKNLNDLNAERDSLMQQNLELQKELKQSMLYQQNIYAMDWTRIKLMAFAPSPEFRLFETARRLSEQDVPWNAQGSTPDEGFNSPSFAAYVLNRMGVAAPLPATSSALRIRFEPTNKPREGDLIFYEGGYVMFFFKAASGPFCIGMTPAGIVSLHVDFGPKLLGYGRVEY